jgi:AcrR family transcriptional regulator
MTKRPGRPKAGRRSLARDEILSKALELVDTEGVESLTMRRLAKELSVDPMAIYHHLDGKRAVLDGLIELIFNELQVPKTRSPHWQDQVRAFATAYRNLARAHPHLVLYLVSNFSFESEAVLSANESLYSALERAGLMPIMIVQAADTIVDYLNAVAMAAVSERRNSGAAPGAVLQTLHKHPQQDFTTLRRVFAKVSEHDFRSNSGGVDAGLEIILLGIEVIAEQGKPSSA